jgi:hypothetical protein
MNGIRPGRLALLVLGAGLAGLVALGGCERESKSDSVPASPKAGVARPAASEQPAPSEDDLAALREGVRRETGLSAPSSTAGLPANHPPIGGPLPVPPAPRTAQKDYVWDAPGDWQSQPPRSAMRRAQYLLPRVEGDAADGELVIFDQRSLSGGGGVEDNLARWRGMMTATDGSPLPPEATTREDFEVNGVRVAMIDVSGRYAPSQMPGMPASDPLDEARMLAAVVQAEGQVFYIRATGPARTMAAHRDGFKAFLSSFRPAQ